MQTMKLGDYIARIEYDDSADMLHGLIINIQDTVDFYGSSIDELKSEFRESLDVYLEVCQEKGIEPTKAYSGTLNLRLGPELHSIAAAKASASGTSLNVWLIDAIKEHAH